MMNVSTHLIDCVPTIPICVCTIEALFVFWKVFQEDETGRILARTTCIGHSRLLTQHPQTIVSIILCLIYLL